jgi:hypothetical protein
MDPAIGNPHSNDSAASGYCRYCLLLPEIACQAI